MRQQDSMATIRRAQQRTRSLIANVRQRLHASREEIAALASAAALVQTQIARVRSDGAVLKHTRGAPWATTDPIERLHDDAERIRRALATCKAQRSDLEQRLVPLETMGDGIAAAIAALEREEAGDA